MNKNKRLSNSRLRMVCIKEDWFTGGDIKQYEKLFLLNDENRPHEDLILTIWLCSNDDRASIKAKYENYLNMYGYDING